jgi:AraC-like DNA-binding protein
LNRRRPARGFDLREIGLLYYALASSERLGDSMQRAERYSTITNEGIALRLRDGKDVLAISQIAWLLGYQEVSAFTHAFKRRTGKTPREVHSQKTPLQQQTH